MHKSENRRMKWIKIIISTILFGVSLPLLRLQDWALVVLPSTILKTTLLGIWFAFFIILPFKLLSPRLTGWISLGLLCSLCLMANLTGSFTNQTIFEPELSHCGGMTYTGFLYPMRKFLSDSYKDDLEVKNQMCWLVKMIKKIPEKIPEAELAYHLNLLTKNLEKPTIKYKAALPWIGVLLGKYMISTRDNSGALSDLNNVTLYDKTLTYWKERYTEEISERSYSWLDWPFSSFIKFEYSIIEKDLLNLKIKF
jgi:hypothetical protein